MDTLNSSNGDVRRRTMSKVLRRIIPFMMALYFVNILDRVNLGYVALDMRDELSISAAAYGSLAAAFFVGYFFFEVPSNVMLEKFGANKVISRIMVTWGIVTILTFFVTAYWQIYVLRFLLGVMEAGFFPGVIYYLSQWVPSKHRAKAVTLFFVGSQIGTASSGPIATWIMDNISWLGHAGWRWVFLIEGTPAVLLGVIAFFWLTNQPKDASWLSSDEKEWLTTELAAEKRVNKPENGGAKKAFLSSRVWHLAGIYLLFQAGTQGMVYWLPTVVKGMSDSFSNSTVGVILMIPPLLAIGVMMLLSRHSDRAGERKYHALLPIVLSVAGLAIAGSSGSVALQITGVIVYGSSYPAFLGIFWTLPSIYLTGVQAAVGLAIINSSSSASTFASSTVLGFLNESFGNGGVIALIGGCLGTAALLLLLFKVSDRSLGSEATRTQAPDTTASRPPQTA
ncbi:MFS transporter [Streptomyces coelicoflavus]|uniref:MFS transporter n=1 Tax=Streptomyces coelicoflavus TaxID=285562 RepID=A0A7K3PVC6_9ACTN|nr:MFS transporter [Streptomyces coelicoflavus]NEB13934.1 MFS transporter [Streptomyces coelicoflavus]